MIQPPTATDTCFPRLHAKFMIVDMVLQCGSFNYSWNACGNQELIVLLRAGPEPREALVIFDRLFSSSEEVTAARVVSVQERRAGRSRNGRAASRPRSRASRSLSPGPRQITDR